MRIICISDTHNLHKDTFIPDGDILIHAGDITAIGNKEIVVDFNQWLGQLPHKHKIVIAGNHDLCFESEDFQTESFLTNATYLKNSGIEIEGLKIWGSPISPISPKFGNDWAFNIERGDKIRKYWEKIPTDTDILITHCPPFGILDKNELGSFEGCKDLLDIVQNSVKPRFHIFGHIHEAYGRQQIGQTTFINASIVDLQNWITKYKFIRRLRITATFVFQTLKKVHKLVFKVSKDRSHNRKFSHSHWTVKNKAIVIDIGHEINTTTHIGLQQAD